ncbi:putative olfactory receptor 14L1 [Tachyglossus aculeatus]|uniref:putative olfactory receptor 14L1 n=1 Tax=Tachyglossus aculeatus TaxID=9261 RepID=UPI0018F7CF60|nr:putative olfactory receptor 14L1 [Tachyglossus aculeatus]
MEFLLLSFSGVRGLQLVHATLFLLAYLVAQMGNLIVAVTIPNRRLHTRMYLFRNLYFLARCLISVTVPKSTFKSLTKCNPISFLECVFPVFFLLLCACAELCFLTMISYDRQVTICLSLRYDIIMNRGACEEMAAASWLSGVIRLSNSSGKIWELIATAFSSSLTFICFVSIVISYIRMFEAMLRVPSGESRSKAFSTCLPHLVVVTLFVSTGDAAYLKPVSESPSALDLLT